METNGGHTVGSEMLPGVGGQGLGNPTTPVLRPLYLMACGCVPELAHLLASGFGSKHRVLGNKGTSCCVAQSRQQATYPTLSFLGLQTQECWFHLLLKALGNDWPLVGLMKCSFSQSKGIYVNCNVELWRGY